MIQKVLLLNFRLFLSVSVSFISTGILVTNTLESHYATFVFYGSVFSLGMSFSNSLNTVAQKFFIEKKESYLPLIVIFVALSVLLAFVLTFIKLTFFETSSALMNLMFYIMLLSNFIQIINELFVAHIFAIGDVHILARVGLYDGLIKGSFIIFYSQIEETMIFWVLLLLISNLVSSFVYFFHFKKSIPKKLIYRKEAVIEVLNYWRWFILGSVEKNLRGNGLVIAMRMSSYGDKLVVAYSLYRQIENGIKKIGATIDSIARPRLVKINISGDILKLTLIYRKVVVATLIVIVLPYLGISLFAQEFVIGWIGHVPEYYLDFIQSGLLMIFIDCLFKYLMNLIYLDKSPRKFQLISAIITVLFFVAIILMAYLDFHPLWFVWAPVIFGILGITGRYIVVPKNERNRTMISGVRFDIFGILLVILTLGLYSIKLTLVVKCVVLLFSIVGVILFYNRILFKLSLKSVFALITP